MTRWLAAKQVAASVAVEPRTVWEWVRAGKVRAKRLPGERGRVLVAVDEDGFPVTVRRRRT